MELLKHTQEAILALEGFKQEIFSCNQDRSFYQIEKFVIGQHDTPSRRYLNLMTELHICYMEIKSLLIEHEEGRLDLEEMQIELEESSGQLAGRRVAIKISKAQLKMEGIEYRLDAKLKEFYKFMTIKRGMKSFTAQEIEEGERPYYEARLQRQALEDRASQAFGISVGNLRALVQAGKMELLQEGDKLLLRVPEPLENKKYAEK